MQFHNILTSIALSGCIALSVATSAQAQPLEARKTAADEAILEMSQAFKRGDIKGLNALLPKVEGHVLEPWGAYWALRARLDQAARAKFRRF